MASVKPSKQTQILLEEMSRRSDDDKSRWDQMLESVDLLFDRMNDINLAQQDLKNQVMANNQKVDNFTAQQDFISQQVKANGQAVARLTLKQFDREESLGSEGSSSEVLEDEEFQNMFGKGKAPYKPACSHQPKHQVDNHRKDDLPHHSLPKMQFPSFDGVHPTIWFDNCENYFSIYSIPEKLWVTAAAMHLQHNAAKWWQAYKKHHQKISWKAFCEAVHLEFGSDDYRSAVTDLLNLKQTGTVEEYTTQFQALQFEVSMEGSQVDEQFFATAYINGLKEDIRAVVEPHTPTTVKKAVTIAKIQQRQVERGKAKYQKQPNHPRQPYQKQDARPNPTYGTIWRDKQLRDYRKANNLCFSCGEKFEPGHAEVCTRRNKPQINALVANDLDKEISEDLLNDMAIEEILNEDFCQLSLNAISGTDSPHCIKLKTTVKNKTMLTLVDTGSSHSFVSAHFVQMTQLPTEPIHKQKVKLANGEWMTVAIKVPNLTWYIQGHTFTSDLIVLDMLPYDAILGFDWLESHSPMQCDWVSKTLTFQHKGQQVTLKGIQPPPLQLTTISAKQVYKSSQGNDIWAFVVLDTIQDKPATHKSVPVAANEEVQLLLHQYADVFQDPQTLPPPRSYDHAIPLLPDGVPFNSRPYHYSPQHKTEIENQVKQLLEKGLITHSHSPYASPVLLVKKKDGSWRFCIDYRKLNSLTIKNKFPMPIIEEILDELQGSKVFTKLDMRSGYHQVRMLSADEEKTAFKTNQGHYQFKVMPFGLTNAPATFQCIMNEVLQPFLRQFVLVFLDDILIYSKSLEDHLQHLQQVLETLRQHQLYLKASKCSFAQHSLEYLGHIISDQGVSTDHTKTQNMLNWPVPTSFTDLRAFLGLTGYYRKFVKHYGIIAKPLTSILKQKQFQWTEQANTAFQQLKQAMTTTPVLALPNFQAQFTIETDACKDGVGAVLMQQGQPLAYLSKALGDKHKNLSIYEKEFLALIMAVDKWRHYLQRQEFIILTDLRSLQYLSEQHLHSDMQRKAMTRLMGLQFKIKYRKGKENMAADALSRVAHMMAVQSVVQPQWIQEVLNSYTTDPHAQQLLTQLALSSPDSNGYSLHKGLIKLHDLIWIGNNSALQTKLIAACHSSAIGGHSGVTATYHRLRRHFVWKGMRNDVDSYIKQCSICQHAKHTNAHPAGLLQPLPIPSGVWKDISMDFIEGLPKSEGYSVIMVIVDRLTKYAHFIPVKHPYTAPSIAKLFLDHIVKLYGMPQSIVSDRDTIFVSSFWKELFKLYKVTLNLSTAYHPQTDGQTERVNQCLEMYLIPVSLTSPAIAGGHGSYRFS